MIKYKIFQLCSNNKFEQFTFTDALYYNLITIKSNCVKSNSNKVIVIEELGIFYKTRNLCLGDIYIKKTNKDTLKKYIIIFDKKTQSFKLKNNNKVLRKNLKESLKHCKYIGNINFEIKK